MSLDWQQQLDAENNQATRESEFAEKVNDTRLRFEAARFIGMKLVTVVGGIPLFEGTPEQYRKFHRYIGTPNL